MDTVTSLGSQLAHFAEHWRADCSGCCGFIPEHRARLLTTKEPHSTSCRDHMCCFESQVMVEGSSGKELLKLEVCNFRNNKTKDGKLKNAKVEGYGNPLASSGVLEFGASLPSAGCRSHSSERRQLSLGVCTGCEVNRQGKASSSECQAFLSPPFFISPEDCVLHRKCLDASFLPRFYWGVSPV